MFISTVIMMEMIALTITMMGSMMNSLKIAMTITRNTISIIVWMILRER